MKHIVLMVLVLGFIHVSLAQTITVKDAQTQLPLEGVVLTAKEAQPFTVTNSEGQADLTAFKNAKQIQLQLLGYKTEVFSYAQLLEIDFTVGLQTASLNLDQVVVSATKWRQSNSSVASKIVSISAKEVAFQNPQTAADLLGVSGKVFIQKSQQGGGSPMIRGFSTNRLIYTVDGVRMNTAIFRGGNLQNVINIDPFATENTEVLFGPGSVIYGSDAIGGVMSFQTLTPQLSLTDKPIISGKAVTRYSSANSEKTGHVDVHVGWEKWALVSSFSTWNYNHLRQGSNGPKDYVKDYYVQRQNGTDVIITQEDPLLQIPSAYAQINLMQKIRFKPSQNWDVQYGFHYSETSPYGRYDRHNRVRRGNPQYGEWNYGPQAWMMHNLAVNHSKNNAVYDQVTLRLAQQEFNESRISRNFNNNVRERRAENVLAYSANLDFTKGLGSKNTLFYGVEYVLNDVTSVGTDEFLPTNSIAADSVLNGASRYPQATWNSAAVYINDEFRVSKNFTLQAGARYNQVLLDADFSNNTAFYPLPFVQTSLNNGALTGSLGGIYKPNNTWIVKANLGSAFRAPNVDDVGKVFDPAPGSVVVPNPDLQPEYAYNVDVSVAKVFGESVKVEANVYYTILRNALIRRDFQLNGLDSIIYDGALSQVQAIQNAAVANVYGVQASIEVNLTGGFKFFSDFNYQKGEEELDDGTLSASRHAAPLFGVSRLRYSYNALMLEINAQYQGERAHQNLAVEEQAKTEIYALNADGETYAPSWYTLNFRAMYQITPQFSVSGGLENITDQRYRPYSSGISGAGRNFVLALTAKF